MLGTVQRYRIAQSLSQSINNQIVGITQEVRAIATDRKMEGWTDKGYKNKVMQLLNYVYVLPQNIFPNMQPKLYSLYPL